ncbi:19385_t:CDS:1, partial [Racocetra persica]
SENVVLEDTTVMTYTEDIEYQEFNKVYDEYVEKHNKIIAKLLEPSAEHNLTELPKVVVVQPGMSSGYGNRLPSIVCGFIYSLISDRLFFINGYKNFENYYEKDFDHDWATVENLYKDSTFKYIHDKETYNDFPLVTRGNFSSKEITKYEILGVSTLDYPCAPITSNPYYMKWFNKAISDYRIFTAVSLKLLRLHPNISKQVENFTSNNFGDYNIGIHLRENKPPS